MSALASQPVSETQPPPTSLLRHYSRYLTANVLAVLAGLISYPIMARLLSEEEIGIFGFFEIFALIWIAVLKLGTQNSIQRFYPVFCLKDSTLLRRQQYYASFVQVPALLSVAVCLIAVAVLALVSHFWDIPNARYLYVVIVLGEIGVLYSLVDNVIRAREHSAFSSRVTIVYRYLQLAAFVVIVCFVSRTAMGVYVSRILCGVLILFFLLRWALEKCEFNLKAFSPATFRQGLSYGLPLVWSEISFILLAFVDRLMLKPLSPGTSSEKFEQVGIYIMGYGLAMYIGEFISQSLAPAFNPVANRLYETQGRQAVVVLQRQVLRVLYYAAAAIAVGLIFVGPDMLIIFAGKDKAASVPVFQWIGFNYLLYPIFMVAAYGLHLLKRTKVISKIVFASALLNILLNFLMIPRWGIMGAVYATLISYFVMGGLQFFICPADHRPTPAVGDLARPIGAALLMAASAALLLGAGGWHGILGIQNHYARIIIMAFIFVATFIAPALAIDKPMRRALRERLRQRKK